jgi:hypothetical protein
MHLNIVVRAQIIFVSVCVSVCVYRRSDVLSSIMHV